MYPEPWRRGRVYHFTYTDSSGKRHNKSTGKHTRREADAFIKDFIDSGAKQVLFKDYAEPFFTEECPRCRRLSIEGRSITERHRIASRRWLEYALEVEEFCALALTEVKRGHILALRDVLTVRHPGKYNTINKVITTVQTVFAEAEYRGDISASPVHKVRKIAYERQQKTVLAPEEITHLLKREHWKTGDHWRAFTLMAYTGMRVGEVAPLTFRQIEDGYINIDMAIKHWELRITGAPKNGKPRRIPLAYPARDVLQPNTGGLVFPSYKGEWHTMTWFRKGLLHALKKAELDTSFTPHGFRHSLNTNLLAAGENPIAVAIYLGHTPPVAEITRQYFREGAVDLTGVRDTIERIY